MTSANIKNQECLLEQTNEKALTNCRNITFIKFPITVPINQTCFTHITVP